MRLRILVVASTALVAGLWVASAAVPPAVVHVPPPLLDTVDGAELYGAYCSSCHGVTGRGNGAVSPYLAVAAPDLTRIAERHGGFDSLAVHRAVSGVDRSPGSVMPIWSPKLEAAYSSSERERVILHNLVLHLESMQSGTARPTEPATTHPRLVQQPVPPIHRIDGVTIYASLCADCHGADGRGNGRLAAILETPIPDLTLLWVRNGGTFDREEVRDAIAVRHMVPLEEADPWWEVLVDSYGFMQGNLMLAELTRHVEAMQEPR